MTMSKAERGFHRKTAARCFNETWDYLAKKNRTTRDDQRLLHLAHAGRYHWSFIGGARHLAVGDWQISRVYAALNQPELALQFAKSCLEICQKNSLSEILHTAHEGIARAYAVSKDYPTAKSHIHKARELFGNLSLDEEDKNVYLDQIRETEALIVQ